MGENKHINELDAFAKKYVKEIPREKPSKDFTASIMQNILQESQSKVFKTKALISKKGWFVITAFILGIIFIPYKTSEKSILNLPELDFSFLDKIHITNLIEPISVSNTVLFSIFFFGLMIIAQVFYLKNYFDKRYN